jgi:hypothetical protein
MRVTILALAMAVAASAAAHDEKGPRDHDRVNGGIHIDANENAGDLSTVNGGITVGSGAQVQSVETVNGGIRLSEGARAQRVETVNGGLHLGARSHIADSAETVNGGIELGDGAEVVGPVENVNGGINLDHAHVGGGIKTVNGDVTVGEGSIVDVGIKVERPTGWFTGWFGNNRPPRIVIAANAQVNGPMTFERDVELYVHESAKIGSVNGATAKRYTGNPPARNRD